MIIAKTYTTTEMLQKVIEANGHCLEYRKILSHNWYSTYFIYHKRTYKNGKITFMVDYDSSEYTWTNYDFLEFNADDIWQTSNPKTS